MNAHNQLLTDVSHLLEYPGEETPGLAQRTAETWKEGPMAQAIQALAEWAGKDPRGCEERYTQLFDMSPRCTLNVGYHLFGEDYQRGLLLAYLQAELRNAGVEDEKDLPDYLPTLLRLLVNLEDPEDKTLLVERLIVPGLEKMTSELEGDKTPFSSILRALPELLSSTPEARA